MKTKSECLIYTNRELPGWSKLTGKERCDRVSDALDDLYAGVDGVIRRISLKSLDGQTCIDTVPSECDLTLADVFCAVRQALDEAEMMIGELEEKRNGWGEGACRFKI
jgi:hypothetical protein